MNYTMTKPCDACPFLIGSGFSYSSLLMHASAVKGFRIRLIAAGFLVRLAARLVARELTAGVHQQ